MKTFLSSTYVDLVEHRQAAAEAVERLGQQVGRMEVFGARPDEPSEACLAEIDDCDLFVGIYAHRYGYVPDGSPVSITEAEFDHAKAKGKPLFCFVIDEEHPWPPKLIDDEPLKSRLRSFKAKIGSGLVRDTFTTSQDLAYKIAAALGRYLTNRGKAGPISTNAPDLLLGYTEFFNKILSEVASLRLELQGQKELLQKVNHISDLLQLSGQNVNVANPVNNTFPVGMEGCWVDSITDTTLYARFVHDELLVPYCYRGNSHLTGIFFDFRKRSENVFFARFKWINSLIQGFAYIEFSHSGTVTGGWWFSEDVPKHALEDLERFDPDLPRMRELALSRCPKSQIPNWVDDFFAAPQSEMLKQIHSDS
jgi:hypothetical protein